MKKRQHWIFPGWWQDPLWILKKNNNKKTKEKQKHTPHTRLTHATHTPHTRHMWPRRHSLRPRHGETSENKSKNINALPVPLPRQVSPEACFVGRGGVSEGSPENAARPPQGRPRDPKSHQNDAKMEPTRVSWGALGAYWASPGLPCGLCGGALASPG